MEFFKLQFEKIVLRWSKKIKKRSTKAIGLHSLLTILTGVDNATLETKTGGQAIFSFLFNYSYIVLKICIIADNSKKFTKNNNITSYITQ